MPGRATLRDIAQMAGCHHSTVSLALRRHPSIPQATCDRIILLAAKMEYRTNPHLSAWMIDVRTRNTGHYKATLAYLDPGKKPEDPHRMKYYHGASNRAAELGYKLSYHWLHEPGMTARRMAQIFLSSGIRGIVIGPTGPRSHISFPWNKFAAVTIGHSLLRPRLNRVAHDQFRGLQTVIRAVTKRGYHRVGLMLSEDLDIRTNYAFSSFMARYHLTIPAHNQIPIYYHKEDADLHPWYSRWRPECVVGGTFVINAFLKFVGPDPGIVDLDLEQDSVKGSAGIDQRYEQIGAVAVEMLGSALSVNRLGIPEQPLTTLIEGRWREGSTLPKKMADEPQHEITEAFLKGDD